MDDNKYIYTYKYKEQYELLILEKKILYCLFNIIYLLRYNDKSNYYMRIYSIIDELLKDNYNFESYYSLEHYLKELDYYKFKSFDNDIKLLKNINNNISNFIIYINNLSIEKQIKEFGIDSANSFLLGIDYNTIEELNSIEFEDNYEIISFNNFKNRLIETNRLINEQINLL